MKTKEIREIILKELPSIIEEDKEIHDLILRLSKEHFADKEKTDNRFDKILKELAADREIQIKEWDVQNQRWAEQTKRWDEQDKRWQEQAKRWEEQDKKWAEQARQWDENNKRWAENVKRWDENDKRWAANAKRWDENDKRWEEQEKKWQENQQIIRDILESIKVLNRKHEQSIGALGARWGLRSEQSFRNALKGILGEVSELEVVNVVEYDEEGEVFGSPDQIELDLIIKNGLLVICEIKSSMSKADMHIFHKKAEFYQKKHNRKAQRLMVISPMIDKKASELARNLGIQTYSYVEDIEPNAFSV